MNKERFLLLIKNAGLYLVGADDTSLRFAVALRQGSIDHHHGIFEFDPIKFRAMTEEDAKAHIKRCKLSMRREAQKSSAVLW